jgi:hypothetical protein
MNKLDVSLIVPCYYEEPHLYRNIHEIVRVMNYTKWTYEVIYVEDGSGDGTRGVIERLVKENSGHRAIFHERNMGRGAAVMTGLVNSKGKIAGFLDIDLEVHARYIPDAISYIADCGYDMTIGRRDYRVHFTPRNIIRHIMTSAYARLCHMVLPVPVKDSEAGFKFFRLERIAPILGTVKNQGWFWDTEIVVRAGLVGLRIGEVDCLFVRNYQKKSTVKVISDTKDYFSALLRMRRVLKSEREGGNGL